MKFAPVGHDVFVGSWEACDQQGHDFDRVVHIYHPRCTPAKCCKAWSERPAGLYLELAEGAAISTCPTPIEEIAEFCRHPGRLLIHCTYGQQRSATLAILAKAVRGANVFDALGEVASGLWYGRGIPPFLCALPQADIYTRFAPRHAPN